MEEVLNPQLTSVKQTQKDLRIRKEKEIVFSSSIIYQFGKPLIHPNTINVIQGKAGQHKSRLAETVCARLLSTPDCTNTLLQFSRNEFQPFYLLYVDTERNLKEQFPYALQQIQTKAGFSISDHPDNFDYISLLNIARHERYQVLDDYLKHLRETTTDKHLFVVLDVASDCVSDFNQVGVSMQLIDMMNVTINEYDVTFLCIIHENPGGEKARGHLGTELINKASLVLSVAYVKDAKQNQTDFIHVKCMKTRVIKMPDTYFIKYAEDTHELVLASTEEISELVKEKTRKADPDIICDYLEKHIAEKPMSHSQLAEKLCKDFNASERTIRERLNLIEEEKRELTNGKEICILNKKKVGKEAIWELLPISNNGNGNSM